jgi:hypothetical protein
MREGKRAAAANKRFTGNSWVKALKKPRKP